jgi:hypothetical protein
MTPEYFRISAANNCAWFSPGLASAPSRLKQNAAGV